jgi:hypothetical protein
MLSEPLDTTLQSYIDVSRGPPAVCRYRKRRTLAQLHTDSFDIDGATGGPLLHRILILLVMLV